jgi:hypothetical protein
MFSDGTTSPNPASLLKKYIIRGMSMNCYGENQEAPDIHAIDPPGRTHLAL